MTINAISAVIPTAQGRANLNNTQNVSFTGIPANIRHEVGNFFIKKNALGAAGLFYNLKTLGKTFCHVATVQIPLMFGALLATDPIPTQHAAFFTGILTGFTGGITLIARSRLKSNAKALASELKAKGYSLEDRMAAVKDYIKREAVLLDYTLLRKRTIAKLAIAGDETGHALAATA